MATDSAPYRNKEILMYRLMKSEKLNLAHVIHGTMSSYQQIQTEQFQGFGAALIACETANNKVGLRYYILNDSGKEYYEGSWID